jgi:endonuclease IV
MFGSHLSIAGGMHNALIAAEGYGRETVQVFTKNQAASCPKSATGKWPQQFQMFAVYSQLYGEEWGHGNALSVSVE